MGGDSGAYASVYVGQRAPKRPELLPEPRGLIGFCGDAVGLPPSLPMPRSCTFVLTRTGGEIGNARVILAAARTSRLGEDVYGMRARWSSECFIGDLERVLIGVRGLQGKTSPFINVQ